MRYLIALLFCFGLAAQQTVNNFTVKTNLTVAGAPVTLSVNTIADLVALNPIYDNAQVSVAGYYSAGDGGGGTFRRVLSSSGSTNLGTFFESTANPTYSWSRVVDDPFVNVKWFGAKGDNSADDTVSIQSAINYAQSLQNKPAVVFPAGRYVVSSITSINVSLESLAGGTISNGGTPLDSASQATLVHKVGATNDLLTLAPVGNPVPNVRRISFVGRREQNRKKTCAITAVSDRFNFVVATNNLPDAPPSYTNWPYYGYCFFFSNEGRYIGSGLVKSINYTTGAIELQPSTDQYATKTTASNLLSTGFEVSFAETTTEYANYAINTGVDSSKAGYNAINLTATATNLISEVVLSDLKIRGFHTGIRLGNNLFTFLKDIFINSCSFASIASAFPGQSRDGIQSGLFLQGFYSESGASWPSPETNSFVNTAYRATLFGYYGVENSAVIDDIRVDHTVHGLYFQDIIDTMINQVLTDNTVSHALMFGGNAYGSGRVNIEIGQAQLRNVNAASYVASSTNKSYAIKTFGNDNQNLIHGLSVSAFGTNRFFDAVFDTIGSGNRIVVDNLFSTTGATNSTLYSSTSTSYPLLSAKSGTVNQLSLDVAGSQKQLITSTQHTISNAVYASDSITSGQSIISGGGKTTIAGSGGVSINSTGLSLFHGSDQGNVNARTDLTGKQTIFGVPTYTNSSPAATIFTAYANQSANDIYIGGGVSFLEPAQTIRFLIGSKATGSGSEIGRFNSTGFQVSSGNASISQVGSGLRIKEGTNAKMGTATLVAGSATVSTTAVASDSRIQLTGNADGGTPGWLRVSARTAGTSFTITSSSATDTSTVAWVIIDPAP